MTSAIAVIMPRLLPLVIAGSRGLLVTSDQIHEEVDAMLAEFNLVPNEVVSGCARGVDQAGEHWAASTGLPIKRFPVTPDEWRRLGKKAGPMRNMEMARYAGAGLVFWDGSSRGSADMARQLRDRRKPVRVVEVRR